MTNSNCIGTEAHIECTLILETHRTHNNATLEADIITGIGKLTLNASYELRKILQKPRVPINKIEAERNPAYNVTSSLREVQQEAYFGVGSHEYETIREATRAASDV